MRPRSKHRSLAYPPRWRMGLLVFAACYAALSTNALSKGFQSPEECLAYDGDAHLNCVYAYIEVQRDTIMKLESQLHKEQQTSGKLRNTVDRQLSIHERLERQIAKHERNVDTYRYPPIGLYSGFPYGFGQYPYHRRFFGPRFGFHIGPYSPIW
ncbi:MAG: hypothetical protein MRJ96_01160 [Nitrospirales bacterium]|nr:hypothetical protein [Nitrospira sp.]MDR4500051.1 hypothetical protein [Nitrospirales bacterium]